MSVAEGRPAVGLRDWRGRVLLAILAAALSVTGVVALVTRAHAPQRPAQKPVVAAPVAVTPTLPPTSMTTPTTTPPTAVPPVTILATPTGTIPTYAAPGSASGPGSAPIGTVGTWYGYPLTLPVIGQQGTWLDVRLPQRPNGSTAWVSQGDVTLTSTPYRIVVQLTQQDLIVYQAGIRILAFPVGLGLPATPTPTGNYFVAVRETNLPPQSYGPVVLDTSAHSDTIQSWEGAGDAIIAIHGPITAAADAAIGAAGTRISNGCIRLHLSDLAQLEMIPVGTPVDITA
jgi:lipoprotein-anchoring transpeptidase ErfK/SrfK